MEEIKITIRKPTPADKNFILATWLKGQRWGSQHYSWVPQDLYFDKYGPKIIEILKTPGVDIRIACDQEIPTWIAGYSIFKDHELYWIHVRKDYRGKGIAKLLLSGQPITTAKAMTWTGAAIAEKHGIAFDPF